MARSGVSPPDLGPPRREVTPGTMEAAINLKSQVDIAGGLSPRPPQRMRQNSTWFDAVADEIYAPYLQALPWAIGWRIMLNFRVIS